jgi:hypothetical protein
MKRKLTYVAAILVLGLSSGCGGGRHSATGFRLPESGSVDRGKTAFVELQCTRCHTIEGIELPAPTMVGMEIPLGGEVYDPRTDGYLVTSIIHPSHRLAHVSRIRAAGPEDISHMPDYARGMTVRQMMDLVAFLQSTYTVVEPPSTLY